MSRVRMNYAIGQSRIITGFPICWYRQDGLSASVLGTNVIFNRNGEDGYNKNSSDLHWYIECDRQQYRSYKSRCHYNHKWVQDIVHLNLYRASGFIIVVAKTATPTDSESKLATARSRISLNELVIIWAHWRCLLGTKLKLRLGPLGIHVCRLRSSYVGHLVQMRIDLVR